MKAIVRVVAAGAITAGVAIGMASPAIADPGEGPYTATMLQAGTTGKQEGSTTTWTLSSCGPDCVHLATMTGGGWDLRRQGPLWNGANPNNTASLDENSMLLTIQYPGEPPVLIGLTR